MAQLSPVCSSVSTCIVVWLDAREAMIVTWQEGQTHFERVFSDVPAHHRSTGHVRHVGPGSPGAGPPRSAGEGHRLEHLRRYVEDVAEKVAGGERVRILGPRPIVDRLLGQLRNPAHRQPRVSDVGGRPSPRLTESQLVATVRQLAGDVPARGTVGAYRWTGVQPTTVAGQRRPPRRVAPKRRRPPDGPRDEEEE